MKLLGLVSHEDTWDSCSSLWWTPRFHSYVDEKIFSIESPVLIELRLVRWIRSPCGSWCASSFTGAAIILLFHCWGAAKSAKCQTTAGPERYLFPRRGAMEWLCTLSTSRYSEQVHFIHICNSSACLKLVPAAPSLRVCVNIIIFSVARSWIARGCACGLGRLPLDRGIVWVSRFSSLMFSFRAGHQVSTLWLARLCSVPFIPVGFFLLLASQL